MPDVTVSVGASYPVSSRVSINTFDSGWPTNTFNDYSTDKLVRAAAFNSVACQHVDQRQRSSLRPFFDFSALPTGTFTAAVLNINITTSGTNYPTDLFGDWDGSDPTDSSDLSPFPATGAAFTVVGTYGATEDFSVTLDETALSNVLMAMIVTTDDGGDPGDYDAGAPGPACWTGNGTDITVNSMSIDITYHVVDDGGTPTHPRPGTPTHTPPIPPTAIPGLSGLTVNHRTPPEMAANNLSGRNTPDIRVSTNLRVASGPRIVSHD